MKKTTFIDSVRVKDPCTENWDEMAGNDQVRFCSHCAKSVNNISSMTPRKAAKLVMRSDGKLCIRYLREPDTGAPIFVPNLVKIAGRAGLAAGVLGASLAVAQPSFAQGSPVPAETVQIDGVPNRDGSPTKVTGTVTDQQGAVIPFAVVSIVNKANGDSRWVNADAEGSYEFVDVPAGKYSLKIEAVGFQTLEQAEIFVSEGSQLRRNAQLEIPQLETVVQVGGNQEGEGETIFLGGVISATVTSNPLVQAVLNDDLEEVKVRVLMRSRINVRDKSYDGMSPLHAAVQNGNVEIARFLLERGAKVNIRDYEKRTPTMMMDDDASVEMVQLLISYGSKLKLVDKEKNNALHHLAENGVEPEIIRYLISSGIDINAVNKEGRTPLMLAAANSQNEIVTALLENGANASSTTRDGKSAWDLTESETVRSALVAYGVQPRQ
ncbi:MAG: ankyrin repeat domain-containing protein [Pyrinomonadaceae bacterium]